MRQLATVLLALTVTATLASVISPVSAAVLPSAAHPRGTTYSVLQMNLCLSGSADCYPRTAYPGVVDEAVEQILDNDPAAVTLNEACSADAADVARRTGYQMRFTAILFGDAPLRCVEPGHRGVFGLAVFTRDTIRTSDDEAFAIHTGLEERRWICATTAHDITVCTAHLGTRGSTAARRANDAECAELQGVLARYDEDGTTLFGGDVNRRNPCAPDTMWARQDIRATQVPGIQHIYGSTSLDKPFPRVATATYTDHDFFLTAGTLQPNFASKTVVTARNACPAADALLPPKGDALCRFNHTRPNRSRSGCERTLK
jgi:endonuclease/exonuclease/phosphatase family metal-dependent hydrolase